MRLDETPRNEERHLICTAEQRLQDCVPGPSRCVDVSEGFQNIERPPLLPTDGPEATHGQVSSAKTQLCNNLD